MEVKTFSCVEDRYKVTEAGVTPEDQFSAHYFP